jgi:hypothetical protein
VIDAIIARASLIMLVDAGAKRTEIGVAHTLVPDHYAAIFNFRFANRRRNRPAALNTIAHISKLALIGSQLLLDKAGKFFTEGTHTTFIERVFGPACWAATFAHDGF